MSLSTFKEATEKLEKLSMETQNSECTNPHCCCYMGDELVLKVCDKFDDIYDSVKGLRLDDFKNRAS